MPGNHRPADQEFFATINRMRRLQRAAGQSQQFVISDTQSRPVINMGLLPGSSPAQYGIELLDASTQDELAQFGQLADGTYGIAIYDATTGNIVAKMGPLSGGGYGVEILDSSGNVLAEMTESGFYVRPAGATSSTPLQRVGGNVYDVGTGGTTSSTTPVTLGTGPSVTVPIGPSGQALVWVSSYVGIGPSGQGFVNLLANGTTVASDLLYVSASDTAANYSMPYVLTGYANSTVTLTLTYRTNGVSTTFGTPTIVCQPN